MSGALFTLLLLAGASGEPSPIIFPTQSIPLRFSHALHLKKSIACDYCHERAPESTQSSDFLIPKEEACQDCHPIERDKPFKQAKIAARCDACHPGWQGQGEPPRVSVPTPHLKFNHKIHVQSNVPCTQCHGDMKQVELATRAELPEMPLCLRCHVGGANKPPSKCGTCHLLTPAGTLRTDFTEGKLAPSGAIRGDTHTPTFRKDHAAVARNDERYCLNCHRRDECLSCHNGVVKPMDFHGNDYVTLHPVDARRDSIRCQACHRLQTFCLGCHQRVGVALDPPGGDPSQPVNPGTRNAFQTGVLKFHPANWVSASFAANPDHHGWQAQRNIRACASCHREETCLRCHTTFADSALEMTGVNPHPPNWAGSSRCRSLVERNKRVCLKCHALNSASFDCVSP